jgi:hypothetical protein
MALFTLLLTIAPAEAAPACNSPSSLTAKTLLFSPGDSDTLNGLSIALAMGLEPATFPAQNVAKLQAPCERAHFDANSASYILYGDDDGLPPRWAAQTGNDKIAFVALLPLPGPALASYRGSPDGTQFKFQNSDMMYVLAVAVGGERQIYRFYDVLPDDARLSGDMCAALNGQLPLLGTFDTATNRSDLARLGSVSAPVANTDCHVRLPAGTK